MKGNAAQDNNNNNKESHSPLRMVFCWVGWMCVLAETIVLACCIQQPTPSPPLIPVPTGRIQFKKMFWGGRLHSLGFLERSSKVSMGSSLQYLGEKLKNKCKRQGHIKRALTLPSCGVVRNLRGPRRKAGVMLP